MSRYFRWLFESDNTILQFPSVLASVALLLTTSYTFIVWTLPPPELIRLTLLAAVAQLVVFIIYKKEQAK